MGPELFLLLFSFVLSLLFPSCSTTGKNQSLHVCEFPTGRVPTLRFTVSPKRLILCSACDGCTRCCFSPAWACPSSLYKCKHRHYNCGPLRRAGLGARARPEMLSFPLGCSTCCLLGFLPQPASGELYSGDSKQEGSMGVKILSFGNLQVCGIRPFNNFLQCHFCQDDKEIILWSRL